MMVNDDCNYLVGGFKHGFYVPASTSDGCQVVLHMGMAYHKLLVGGFKHGFYFP